MSTWIGVDPGGKGNFGLVILKDRTVFPYTVDYVDEAIKEICRHKLQAIEGIGVDAPLWWSSGKSGLRHADELIRSTYNLTSGQVQAVNSLRGACIAQGLLFVERIREIYPEVQITETHPKAVLKANLPSQTWAGLFAELDTDITVDTDPNHERDALISAIAAREAFSGRWTNDLSIKRHSSEQNPLKHWVALIHYYWPEML